jgi:hypothetical protein
MEAFVERATEAVESVVGSHDAPILRSGEGLAHFLPNAELKRKLRGRIGAAQASGSPLGF